MYLIVCVANSWGRREKDGVRALHYYVTPQLESQHFLQMIFSA